MTTRTARTVLFALLTVFLPVALQAQFAPLGQSLVKSRISSTIVSSQMVRVHGSRPAWIDHAIDNGAITGGGVLYNQQLVFIRSLEQNADLQNLLEQQHTPGSSVYHRWLKPTEFAARYGASQSDLQAAAQWLKSQGLTVDSIPPSSDRIIFHGPVSQLNKTFQTSLHSFTVNGRTFHANNSELSVPSTLYGVFSVQNMAEVPMFPRYVLPPKRKNIAPSNGLAAQYTGAPAPLGNVTNAMLAPADIQTIYDIKPLYNAGYSGQGMSIGIIGQTTILPFESDIENFFALTGLSNPNLPQQIEVPNTGGTIAPTAIMGGDLLESDADIEWASSIAPSANIYYITTNAALINGVPGRNGQVLEALQYAIQTPLINNNKDVIPVLSMSYGNCEMWAVSGPTAADNLLGMIGSFVQLFQQANAQGQTLVFAAGDNGSADCGGDSNVSPSKPTYRDIYDNTGISVEFPASFPFATAAGGTSFIGDRVITSPWSFANGTAAPTNAFSQYWAPYASNSSSLESVLSYIPEGAWNDTLPTWISGLDTVISDNGGGGGLSQIFNSNPNPSLYSSGVGPSPLLVPPSLAYLQVKPSWQTGPGVPQDGARDVPDVSMTADAMWDPYVVCYEEMTGFEQLTGTPSCASPAQITASNGKIQPFQDPYGGTGGGSPDFSAAAYSLAGGTSFVAPQLAALISIWNQQAGTPNGVGNANYLFYQIAQNTPSAFHDIVPSTTFPGTNSNAMGCIPGSVSCEAYNGSSTEAITPGYNVTPGYDMATGLGSIDAAVLGSVWGSNNTNPSADFQLAYSPTPVVANMAALYANASITTTPLNGYSGTVTLSCQTGTGTGMTCLFLSCNDAASDSECMNAPPAEGGTVNISDLGSPTAMVTIGSGSNTIPMLVSLNPNISSAAGLFNDTTTVSMPTSVTIVATGNADGKTITHNMVVPIISNPLQPASVALTASATNVTYGVPVTLTYTETSNGAPVPSMNAGTFYDGNTVLGPSNSTQIQYNETNNSQSVTWPWFVAAYDGILDNNVIPVGTHSLTIAVPADLQYEAATSNVLTLTVNKAPAPTVAPASTTLTVAQGGSVTDAITITPISQFTAPMQIACSGLPAATTCFFTFSGPPSQPAGTMYFNNGAPVVATVTIQTTAPVASAVLGPGPKTLNHAPLFVAAFWLPSLLALALARRQRKLLYHHHRQFLALILLLGAFSTFTACGGGSGGGGGGSTPPPPPPASTPKGSYTIQILTSGTGVESTTTNLALTVQ